MISELSEALAARGPAFGASPPVKPPDAATAARAPFDERPTLLRSTSAAPATFSAPPVAPAAVPVPPPLPASVVASQPSAGSCGRGTPMLLDSPASEASAASGSAAALFSGSAAALFLPRGPCSVDHGAPLTASVRRTPFDERPTLLRSTSAAPATFSSTFSSGGGGGATYSESPSSGAAAACGAFGSEAFAEAAATTARQLDFAQVQHVPRAAVGASSYAASAAAAAAALAAAAAEHARLVADTGMAHVRAGASHELVQTKMRRVRLSARCGCSTDSSESGSRVGGSTRSASPEAAAEDAEREVSSAETSNPRFLARI